MRTTSASGLLAAFTGRHHALTLAGALAFVACGDGTGSDGGATPLTAAERTCAAMTESLERCGQPAPCDQALIEDCADVASMLSDPYLEAITDCLETGSATACLASATASLAPSAAQRALAAGFCSSCALGVPGCEEVFFGGGSDGPALVGTLLLPLGDSLVDELAARCLEGPTCAATFSSCAKVVLAERALPESTLTCLVEGLTTPSVADAPAGCAGAGGAGGAGSSSGPASAAASSSSASASASASSSSSASSSGSGGADACAAPDACEAPTALGSLPGDGGSMATTTTGTTSRFLRIQVTETNTSVLPHGLGYRATLDSHPDVQFELHAYVDEPQCAGPEEPGGPTVIESAWPDSGPIDSRWILLEVRHVGGACAPDKPWTLVVEGNP